MLSAPDALDAGFEEFDNRLELVTEHMWELPTPCERFSVLKLVNHVTAGCVVYDLLLQGLGFADVVSKLPARSDWRDATEQCRNATSHLKRTFHQEGALDRVVDHPSNEPIWRTLPPTRGWDLLDYRLFDMVVHAWDLATAIGANDTLDEELALVTYQRFLPHAQFMLDAGFVAPPLPPAPAGTNQGRLLAITGRAM